jgi:hypothetical protein
LTAAIYGFDAAWALGDVDTAVGLLRDHYDEQVHDVRLVRPLLTASEAAPWSDADLLEVWRRFETDFLSEREPNNAAALRITAAYNVLDSAADVIRFTDRLITRSDAVRTHRARALYALRRFDEAITELDELSSSQPRWDAIKLRSRIALERGEFVEALRLRDAFPDPHGQHDESLYHALLQLGRFVDAFESHESQDVRTRLRAVFGAAADVDIAAHVQRRVVIHEAGPGDEIMLAATYSALIERSEHLTISCEPRLHSLLQRSFPAIDFVPVERLRTPRLGHLHPDGPQRPRTPMFRLVDERVHEAALVANSVAAATRLPLLTLSPTWSAPTSYLTADPHRRERIAATSGTGGLGIVWRSELRSISRDIHYLSVDDLEPLLRDHDRVVCLQHDVTGPERQRLLELASGHVEFLDDIDLRNDFESTAAAVTLLDCVVGVGTTMVELAAGLGMPTVMIQPTHFGTWRATGDRRTDYWHASTVLAYADPPWDTDQLVADTTRRLAATFDMSSGGSDDDALM